jgi:hypothetical protein
MCTSRTVTLTLPKWTADLTLARTVPVRDKRRESLMDVKQTGVFNVVNKSIKVQSRIFGDVAIYFYRTVRQ